MCYTKIKKNVPLIRYRVPFLDILGETYYNKTQQRKTVRVLLPVRI